MSAYSGKHYDEHDKGLGKRNPGVKGWVQDDLNSVIKLQEASRLLQMNP
jgi:hypothetical protein